LVQKICNLEELIKYKKYLVPLLFCPTTILEKGRTTSVPKRLALLTKKATGNLVALAVIDDAGAAMPAALTG
jgi:hypothetical protein